MAQVLQIKTHVTNTRAVLYLLASNGSFLSRASLTQVSQAIYEVLHCHNYLKLPFRA